MAEWQVFRGRAYPSNSPIITIYRGKDRAGLNRAAYDQLGHPTSVYEYVDKETRCIGFSKAPDGAHDARKVSKTGSNYYQVSIDALGKHIGLRDADSGPYTAFQKGEILAIQLRKD